MTHQKTIVHVTSEVAPFYKRGGLGDVTNALANSLEDDHHHNIVICLYYDQQMNGLEKAREKHLVFDFKGVPYECSLFYLELSRVEYYFIKLSDSVLLTENTENSGYRHASEDLVLHFYYGKAIIQLLMDGMIHPDYMYFHDWQTAGFFGFPGRIKKIKTKKNFTTTFIIHNYEFQGDVSMDLCRFIENELSREFETIFSRFQMASLLSLALKNSDFVGTVSYGYARELTEGRAPHVGLKYLDLCNREILTFQNGVDQNLWRSSTSPFLPFNYDYDSLFRKKEIKKAVLREYQFDTCWDTEKPLCLMLCRLAVQKGIGLFTGNSTDVERCVSFFESVLARVSRFIICGNPDTGMRGDVNQCLQTIQKRFKGRFCYINLYSEKTAHRLLAAADMLLAPSLFEPCGLIQIYAMGFGTVPLVRPVGGMKDTVRCFFDDPSSATGFHIDRFGRESLLETLSAAVRVYTAGSGEWEKIVKRGMTVDFSWDRMKRQYLRFMREIDNRKDGPIPFHALRSSIYESWQ